jgi:hypothetical protein
MKIKTRILLVVSTLLVFIGCNSNLDKYPEGFGFKVVSNTDVINSFDSTYTRMYFRKDSVIKINFSEKELLIIYNSIIENGLDKYPDNYSPDCKIKQMPCFQTKLQFAIQNKPKILTYKYNCDYFPVFGYLKSRKHNKILKTIKLINEIVDNKSAVKKLAKSNLIFK